MKLELFYHFMIIFIKYYSALIFILIIISMIYSLLQPLYGLKWYWNNRELDVVTYRRQKNEPFYPLDIWLIISNSDRKIIDSIFFIFLSSFSFLILIPYFFFFFIYIVIFGLQILYIWKYGTKEITIKEDKISDLMINLNVIQILKFIKLNAKISAFFVYYGIISGKKIKIDSIIRNFSSIGLTGKPFWLVNKITFVLTHRQLIMNDIKSKSKLIAVWVFFDSLVEVFNRETLNNIKKYVFINNCKIFKTDKLRTNGLKSYFSTHDVFNQYLHLNRVFVNPIWGYKHLHFGNTIGFGQTLTSKKQIFNNKSLFTDTLVFEKKITENQYFIFTSPNLNMLEFDSYRLQNTLVHYKIHSAKDLLGGILKANFYFSLIIPENIIIQNFLNGKWTQTLLIVDKNNYQSVLYGLRLRYLLDHGLVDTLMLKNLNPNTIEFQIARSDAFVQTYKTDFHLKQETLKFLQNHSNIEILNEFVNHTGENTPWLVERLSNAEDILSGKHNTI